MTRENDLEKLWDEFLEKWPIKRIKKMTLEEYCKVGSHDTFTYWLERKTKELGGISGGSSVSIHGIFERNDENIPKGIDWHLQEYTMKQKNGMVNNKKYSWYEKHGKTPNKAFNSIKEKIIKTIECAKNAELQDIDSINFGDAVKWKIAFLYQDREKISIIPIYKKEMLQFLTKTKKQKKSTLYKIIMEKRKENENIFIFSDRQWKKLEEKNKLEFIKKISVTQIREIKLGKKEMRSINVVKEFFQKTYPERKVFYHTSPRLSQRIDPTTITLLLAYYDEQFVAAFFTRGAQKQNDSKYSYTMQDAIIWLATSISKQTMEEILGKKLTGEHAFNNESFGPDTNKNYKKFIEKLITSKHLQEEDIVLIGNQTSTSVENIKLKKEGENLISPQNTILYGPPGTGKTYHTVNKALSIIENKPEAELKEEPREELKKRFNEYMASSQIQFVTFHQSYSYEEFVEGIKPIPPGEKGNATDTMTYKVVDGIFKEISRIAKLNNSTGLISSKITEKNFDEIYKKFCADVRKNNSLGFKTTTKQIPFEIKINQKEGCSVVKENNHSVSKERIFQYIIDNRKRQSGKSYIDVIGDYIIEKYTLKNIETKSHVLIIDEINRGNVSNIFGELITLIEPDKRAGGKEALSVTLPYSKESLSVPSNLHIIGTMNTADRSVEALDTALRRRFAFEEMPPKPELFEEDKWKWDVIKVAEMLTKINERIEILLDADHAIGHSYFMVEKDERTEEKLKDIFKHNIIPLLQEYFYGDWGKIQMVLGKNFVTSQTINKNVFMEADNSEIMEDYSDNLIYNISDSKNWEIEHFKAIYPNTNENQQESKTDEA